MHKKLQLFCCDVLNECHPQICAYNTVLMKIDHDYIGYHNTCSTTWPVCPAVVKRLPYLGSLLLLLIPSATGATIPYNFVSC